MPPSSDNCMRREGMSCPAVSASQLWREHLDSIPGVSDSAAAYGEGARPSAQAAPQSYQTNGVPGPGSDFVEAILDEVADRIQTGLSAGGLIARR